jgi:hypothetical protein
MKFEMTCLTIPKWVEPFLDNQLDVPTAHAVVRHLETCAGCSLKFENEEKLRTAVKRSLLGDLKAPDGLWEKFLHRALHLPAPIGLSALVDAAALAHRRIPPGLRVAGASEADILAYYRGAAGYLPCAGHVGPMTRAVAPWESAGVLRDVVPGRALACKTYRAESGVATQLSLPRNYVGALNAGELCYPFYTFDRGATSVSVMDCPSGICLFVTEGAEATRRARQELYKEFSSFMGTSKPTLPEHGLRDW